MNALPTPPSATSIPATPRPCSKCGREPRVQGQRWGRRCRTAAKREERALHGLRTARSVRDVPSEQDAQKAIAGRPLQGREPPGAVRHVPLAERLTEAARALLDGLDAAEQATLHQLAALSGQPVFIVVLYAVEKYAREAGRCG